MSDDMKQAELFDAHAGEEARKEALEQVALGNPDLLLALIDAGRRVRDRMETFTSDDVWAELPPDSAPGEPRTMGAALVILRKHGLIVATPEYRKSTKTSNHRRPVMVWRSTKP